MCICVPFPGGKATWNCLSPPSNVDVKNALKRTSLFMACFLIKLRESVQLSIIYTVSQEER
jgi:hypothetical protein